MKEDVDFCTPSLYLKAAYGERMELILYNTEGPGGMLCPGRGGYASEFEPDRFDGDALAEPVSLLA